MNTDEEFELIMTALGSPCAAGWENNGHNYGTSTNVPNVAADGSSCNAPDADRDISTFDCAADWNGGVHRLCWCGPFEGRMICILCETKHKATA